MVNTVVAVYGTEETKTEMKRATSASSMASVSQNELKGKTQQLREWLKAVENVMDPRVEQAIKDQAELKKRMRARRGRAYSSRLPDDDEEEEQEEGEDETSCHGRGRSLSYSIS